MVFMTKATVLFIDGENFLHKVEDILKAEKLIKHKTDIVRMDIQHLISTVLKDYSIKSAHYYGARVTPHDHIPEIAEKSRSVVDSQRRFIRNLRNQNIEFIVCGFVRLMEVKVCKKCGQKAYVFKEKGVDVRIAVDAISMARNGVLGTALLCSSDSDMQPMIAELQKQNVNVIYVSFEGKPNGNLTRQCDGTVAFRKSEIIEAFTKANPPKN